MSDIVSQVRKVADLIGEISAATVEQTSGIGQVSDAVNQLDQVTQQNAALVEESAAAADSLKQQAERLVEAVSIFKLSQGATAEVIHRVSTTSQATVKALPKPAAKGQMPERQARRQADGQRRPGRARQWPGSPGRQRRLGKLLSCQ